MKNLKSKAHIRYDAVLKDLFQQDHPLLLDRLTGGVAVIESLNVEFAIVEERRADLVLRLADRRIFHLDFQGENDNDMAYRTGTYGLFIGRKYRPDALVQTVIYFGEPKMRMSDHLDLGGIHVEYTLMDIREMDAEVLMRSGRPGDLALAMLARGGTERLSEILKKVRTLEGPRREKVLAQMAVLSGLRRLSDKFTMEVRKMGMEVDIEKNVFLRGIRDTALAEGKAEGMSALLGRMLDAKFGPLPKWARLRLDKASLPQIERWAKKALVAPTLEGVLGKKDSR